MNIYLKVLEILLISSLYKHWSVYKYIFTNNGGKYTYKINHINNSCHIIAVARVQWVQVHPVGREINIRGLNLSGKL